MHRRPLPIVVASTIVLGLLAPFGLYISAGLTGLTGVSSRFDFGWAIGLYEEISLHPRIHLLPELVMNLPAGARDMDSTIPGGGTCDANWYFLLGVDVPIGGPPQPLPSAAKSGEA